MNASVMEHMSVHQRGRPISVTINGEPRTEEEQAVQWVTEHTTRSCFHTPKIVSNIFAVAMTTGLTTVIRIRRNKCADVMMTIPRE